MHEYVAPTFEGNGFNCPHCGIWAHQVWYVVKELSWKPLNKAEELAKIRAERAQPLPPPRPTRARPLEASPAPLSVLDEESSGGPRSFQMSRCERCKQYAYWQGGTLFYPPASTAPLPNDDMPTDVKDDFREAREICQRSPRGAAALLRLCVQKLLPHLGEKGDNINNDIGSLVKKGLPVTIQQALDSVRVIGNECVHPGTLDLRDDAKMANALFGLVNLIVQNRISEPKQVTAIFDNLPADKLAAIKKRDGT